ncbi:hypothetical protein AYX14_03662 [Cryptococcus neoformans]|nr:hypothetical protein AYX14_03662 [Cryptococcus neoformans var. grubii]OWZ74830.1 hypothetical protein C365_06820 [Cryptococcus neoformans var. grubii Bt85]OXG10401.1 hypothetical protein C367_06822 [Cryptococcus neoformans var. grubii Ze90-1]OXG10524.1 hypothetical protein C366_06768 [Cryptococcus neoformans var. grubii Tu401-1]
MSTKPRPQTKPTISSPTPLLPLPLPSSPSKRQRIRVPTTAFKLLVGVGILIYLVWVGGFLWECVTLSPGSTKGFALGSGSFAYTQEKAGVRGEGEGIISDKPEAYVTFLSSITDPWYLLSTRLLLYQLHHHPHTSDPSRPLVVLTTSQIPTAVETQLMHQGAEVKRVELLVDGFPIPEGMGENHHWKDQYTKLHIFNLTAYSRLLYLDNDILLLQSLAPLWETNLPTVKTGGVAGVGERNKLNMVENDKRTRPEEGEVKDYLNAGFMMITPDEKTFDELRKVRGYKPFYMEQALLNHYFDWEGAHPWEELDPLSVSHFPQKEDLTRGYYSLHAKMWKDEIDKEVVDYWEESVKDMEQFWRSRMIDV